MRLGPCRPRRRPAPLLLPLLLGAFGSARAEWSGGLTASLFWNCAGAECDRVRMRPFDARLFVYAPQYAPTDPDEFGGARYGEKLWLTGAASDALSEALGPDASCCGSDLTGGCGRCLLVRNPSARRADWKAVVMKKGRCPPERPGCEARELHVSIAVPGYEPPGAPSACGDARLGETHLSPQQAGSCASRPANASPAPCGCAGLPDATEEQRIMQSGCDLFSAWGWTVPDPKLELIHVSCPQAWADRVGGAFGEVGVRPPSLRHLDWLWLGTALLVCGLLFVVGFGIRCWSAKQEKKAATARRQERLKRKNEIRELAESSSSSSSSGSESD